jgi:hypothetical protein
MPITITTAPTPRPIGVTGKRSPYPTVVTVVIAHHSASGIGWILRSGSDFRGFPARPMADQFLVRTSETARRQEGGTYP